MERRYYIAYGSNLNVQQMRWRCPNARIIGTSELKDYRLMFKGSKNRLLPYNRAGNGIHGSRCSLGGLR